MGIGFFFWMLEPSGYSYCIQIINRNVEKLNEGTGLSLDGM